MPLCRRAHHGEDAALCPAVRTQHCRGEGHRQEGRVSPGALRAGGRALVSSRSESARGRAMQLLGRALSVPCRRSYAIAIFFKSAWNFDGSRGASTPHFLSTSMCRLRTARTIVSHSKSYFLCTRAAPRARGPAAASRRRHLFRMWYDSNRRVQSSMPWPGAGAESAGGGVGGRHERAAGRSHCNMLRSRYSLRRLPL